MNTLEMNCVNVSLINETDLPDCMMCGLPGEYRGVDCVGYFGGGFGPLCRFCDQINDLMWDLSDLKNGAFHTVGYIDVDSGKTVYKVFTIWREADDFVTSYQRNAIPAWHLDSRGKEVR